MSWELHTVVARGIPVLRYAQCCSSYEVALEQAHSRIAEPDDDDDVLGVTGHNQMYEILERDRPVGPIYDFRFPDHFDEFFRPRSLLERLAEPIRPQLVNDVTMYVSGMNVESLQRVIEKRGLPPLDRWHLQSHVNDFHYADGRLLVLRRFYLRKE